MRSLKIFTFFIFFLIFQSGRLSSQVFSKGFIFSNEGDTAFGYVIVPENDLPSLNCVFRPTMTDDVAVFGPDEISGYGSARISYTSTRFKWSHSDTIMFTRRLFDGIYDLNYYEMSGFKYFIITRPDSSKYTFRYPPELTRKDIFSGLNIMSKFKLQADSIFPDAPELPEYLSGVKPDIISFINLFNQYHNTLPKEENNKASLKRTFAKGFIINNNNDTIEGFIGIQPRNMIFGNCLFRSGKYEKILEFSPSDIHGFGISGEYKIFIATHFFSGRRDTSAFVRLLFDGSIDLLHLRSSGIDYFLLRNSRNQISELLFPPVINKKEYISGINSSKKFSIRADSIFSELGINDTPKPSTRSILNSLKKYHRENGLQYKVLQGSGWELNAGPVAGVSMLKFIPSGILSEMKAYSDPAPHLGLYLSLENSRYGIGVIMRNTIGYHRENYSYRSKSGSYILYHQTSIKALVNSLQAGVRISSANKIPLNPFAEAGPAFNYYINPEYENYDSRVYNEFKAVLSHYDTDEINSSIFFGYFARAGFDINIGTRNAIRISGEYGHLQGRGKEVIKTGEISATYIIRFR